jgi:hypothetical protein
MNQASDLSCRLQAEERAKPLCQQAVKNIARPAFSVNRAIVKTLTPQRIYEGIVRTTDQNAFSPNNLSLVVNNFWFAPTGALEIVHTIGELYRSLPGWLGVIY